MHANLSVPYHPGASTRDADYTQCKFLINRSSTTHAMTNLSAQCTCLDYEESCWARTHEVGALRRARVVMRMVEYQEAEVARPPPRRESYYY
jgi:hypothetical protein